jgi:hypothetical protein
MTTLASTYVTVVVVVVVVDILGDMYGRENLLLMYV